MPFTTPSLDNRDYAEILRDALARIPVHNPDWTNFNDSDPGMTLLQLFAFMAESILYRANQIPERNRYKFLELMGVKLRPATAAKGLITIQNDRGPIARESLEPGLEVRAGDVRFRTTQGLEVLPIEARIFYKQPLASTDTSADQARQYDRLLKELTQMDRYRELYADQSPGQDGDLLLYETMPLPLPAAGLPLPVVDLADTVDRCLWIALLSLHPGEDARNQARLAMANRILTVGVMPYLDQDAMTIRAGQVAQPGNPVPIVWEIAQVVGQTAPGVAHYVPLSAVTTDAILREPGLVQLQLPDQNRLNTWDWNQMQAQTEGTNDYPPSLAKQGLGDRLITWIRLRIGTVSANQSVQARLSWVGINATQIHQQVPVVDEIVGDGNGTPDQQFRLAHQNILGDRFQLRVDDQPWRRIDDLLAADPEVPIHSPRRPLLQSERLSRSGAAVTGHPSLRNQVFSLDPEAGQITFGDGAHGARPRGSIVATYAYGGGRQGNVGIGLVDRSTALPVGYTVTNPLPTWGGEDAQDISSAEKTIPRVLQHRDRLVSVQDFKDITRQTPGVEVGRVEVMPLFDPSPRQTLTAYFTAQADLLSQISASADTAEALPPLLSELKDLLTKQNQLIDRAINNQPTGEPFRELQRLLRPYASHEIPGAVTLLVLPAHPDYRSTPQPDSSFLQAISNQLSPRRLVTTELHIRGPVYRNLWLSVAIKVLGGYALGPVREAVKQALYRFLSPLYGWHHQQGWPLRVEVAAKELEATVARVDGVRAVDGLNLGIAAGAGGESALQAVAAVPLSGLMLPRLANVAVAVVAVGQAGADVEIPTGEIITPLENLRRAPRLVPDADKVVTPIPVLPERC